MNFSAFTHYHVRKLLCKHLGNLDGMLSGGAGGPSLNPILSHFQPTSATSIAQVREVEALVRLHQELETKAAQDRKGLEELERRILALLGFRLGAVVPHRLPMVKAEHTCQFFCFYCHDRLGEGMRQGNELYGMVYEFRGNLRFQAYQLACVLRAGDIPCLVTTSAKRCRIWVSLRSPAYPVLCSGNPALISTLVAVYAKQCKWRTATTQRHQCSNTFAY